MAHSAQTLSQRLLIDTVARCAGQPLGDLDRGSRLSDLPVSELDFLALVGVLEMLCDRSVPDLDLARCETLGELIDRLLPVPTPAGLGSLDGRADQTADTGRYGHGQSAPEGHPGGSPPRRRATGPGTGHAQQGQAG